MNYKKLVSAALTASTVLWMVGAASLPLANAQTTTTAGLQAQIAALLAQIQQLQSQLGTTGGSQTTTTTSYNYTRDLTVGSKGADVSALQSLLIAQGDLKISAPTGYFGALTQAALAKFQAANGIKPSSGFFGPITRAFVASMSTGSTGTTGSTGSTGSTGTSTSTTSTAAPATGLSVGLASDNPAAGSLVSSYGTGGGSAARIPVLAFNLTASNSGAVTVSQLVFQKTGIVADAAINNAYLIQNGQVVAQYASLSSGVLTFSGLNFSIPAGQTVEYTLAVGLSSSGALAGNTVGFSMPTASDVTAFGPSNSAVTATGAFPLNGNTFTVTTVNNPQLATLGITAGSIGTQVTAGTQGNIVGAWTFNAGINPVYLQNINFHVIGSANMANLQNVKLMVNGTQFGQTLSAVPANGMADFSGNVKLNTGNNNVQVVADVMGSPNMNFQFEVLNSYDVLAVDSQYNVPIAVSNTSGSGTQVSILAGQITMSQDSTTPTGNIAKGMSNVTLAKYDLYAAGEPVKVQWLDFNIALGGVSAGEALSSEIQSVSLTDDAGNQIGTTITTPPSSNSCTPTSPSSLTAGVWAPQYTGGTSELGNVIATTTQTYYDCFGSSGSPINYIVPANTTRVLSLKANVQSTANFSSIQGNLSGDTNNLQGQISSKTASTGGVSGVQLTLVSSNLTAAQNNALGTQNVSAGTSNLKIGSYSLSAASAEGVNVNTVSIELTPNNSSWIGGQTAFQNLKLMVNGTQFGTTQGVLTPGATYVFSGSPINIPAGGTVNVDVYADTLSNATSSYSPATDLTGYTGTGQVAYDSVTSNATVGGQAINFNGQPALSIAADSSNPPAGQIAQNTTGNSLAVFRFTETSNVENVKVTQLNIIDQAAPSSSDFSNLRLYNGSTLLGTANAPTESGTSTWTYVFSSFATPLIVPQGNSVSLTLKGDAGSYTGGSIVDGSNATFSVSSGTVTALGATSNKTALVSGSASGNTMTVLRSIETVAGTPVTSLPPASFQQIGSITFTSNAAGDTEPSALTLTFNSVANTASATFMNSVKLHDVNGNDITQSMGVTTSTTGTVKTWTFSTSTPLVVTAGSSYTLTLWADLSQIAAVANTAQSLTAQIAASGNYSYLDGTNNSPTTVSLPSNVVPITVVSMTTPVGGQF